MGEGVGARGVGSMGLPWDPTTGGHGESSMVKDQVGQIVIIYDQVGK